jgi:hypothetical protein
MQVIVKSLDEIIYREDLYPRIEHSPSTVQSYADQLENLPPIEVNQKNELIDGWHRWTAHKKNQCTEINVIVTETTSDNDVFRLAIERNATHGLQLSNEDKRSTAVKLYDGRNKDYLSKILAVPMRTMQKWLERKDTTLRQEREKKIYSMWLACYTQEEIAQAVGLSESEIKKTTLSFQNAKLPNGTILEANHSDLTPLPIYNVWKQKEYRSDKKHFGNTCIEFLDNLLYLYTKPYQIVVDPFGGSGTTIDLCKKRHRRYWVSDRLPIPERATEIRMADIVDGAPPLHKRWSDVSLLYLDPPYWKQAEGQYSKDRQDLANMDLKLFYKSITDYITVCASKMPTNSTIALIIQPTQWKNENKEVTDHVIDLISFIKTKYIRYSHRISCPYESQQCTPQMVEWSKENKQPLVLTREIIIWKRV